MLIADRLKEVQNSKTWQRVGVAVTVVAYRLGCLADKISQNTGGRLGREDFKNHRVMGHGGKGYGPTRPAPPLPGHARIRHADPAFTLQIYLV
jgi:hypothetical protein